MSYQIAIDGPAGAGKSTIAKEIAKRLGWIYADTGAMYRAMALYFIRNNIKADDESAINGALDDIDISISYTENGQQVNLNGENVNPFIRTEQVSAMTSQVSAYPAVREKLVKLQRQLADEQNVVMDGRDIGTCVLPNAKVKIYLTASSAERARRRYLEYVEKGIESDINEIEKEIIERDNRDMSREVSPLKKADDAVLVDSSDMSIEEVINTIIGIYKSKAEE
ncbi:MAG: (d)CMP kinase [Lachnospiraceae bacterium]|nr:(d)CMP kinase [Lachnospiraceae bacterium]